MTVPIALLVIISLLFLTLERIFPGRQLVESKGWYPRAIFITSIQILITITIAMVWSDFLGRFSFFNLSSFKMPLVEGFISWFVGTFVFYWWHRVRHSKGFWQVFHQIHHSPSRIEVVTSFYKHPLEILVGAFISSLIIYQLLGCSLKGALWYNFFSATGEYFYHANLKTPKWLRYFIQTPELHSIHHQFDVHKYNYSDIPLWDRLFGTYKDSVTFSERCGFPIGAEQKLGAMLVFKDVYVEDSNLKT